MTRPTRTTNILSSELTAEQVEAITHRDGPLLIVAGPGAGKTDVIVRRTAFLVRECGVDPEQMLVTTFTNKAADELYDRLWHFLENSAQKVHVSTIHSFCSMILREYPMHDWGQHFDVLDEREQFLFVYAHLRALGLNAFPKSVKLGDFISDVVCTFNLCTEELIPPEAFEAAVAARGAELLGLKRASPESVAEYAAVAKAYGRYLELLKSEQLMDFGMLQKVTYELLTSRPEVTAELAARFRYILVDEYQDTNRLQVLILKELAKPAFNICAVGDDDQSIYRFRGATVSSFLQFERDFPGAKVLHLNTNFRATPPLVEAATAVITHNAPGRHPKNLKAHRRGGSPPVLIQAETCAQQADAVVRWLVEARQKGRIRSYSDVAILFRSVRYHAQEYLHALKRHNVPFTVGSDGGFFDRDDVIDLKTLIAFCDHKHSWDPSPLRGKLVQLSPETIRAIALWKVNPSEWVREEVLTQMGVRNPADRRALQKLAEVRVRLETGEITTLMDLFYELLRVTGYLERCCRGATIGADAEPESALLNMAQFSELISAFQRRVRTHDPHQLGRYLLMAEAHRSVDAAQPEPRGEAVRVMTVHQAKGLEFPVVVIGSAVQGRFPKRFRPHPYPVPARLRLSGEPDDPHEHLRDERRLFYVAATRAQDVLVIGTSNKITARQAEPSQFIAEMGFARTLVNVPPAELPRAEGFKPRLRAPTRQRIPILGLHSYLLCPMQYKLLYECGFATPELYWAAFGHRVHRALEQLHKRAQAGQVISPAIAAAVLDEVWRPIPHCAPDRDRRLRETAKRYLRQYAETHADRFTRIQWVEEHVQYSPALHAETEVLITGRIDLVCRTDSGLEIIDFKVRTRKGLDVLMPELQVQMYGLACECSLQARVAKLTIHLLSEQPGAELEQFSWDETIARAIRQKVELGVQGILNRVFEPRPGKHCAWCDFKLVCPGSLAPPADAPVPVDNGEPCIGACP